MNHRKIFIQLGRLGDVINILPLAKLESDETGQPCQVMVAREFADVLDGCSYVEPIIWQGDWIDTVKAVYEARKLSDNIVISQIYGRGIGMREMCSSFARESWYSAGAKISWGSKLPVFDRRVIFREECLIDSLGINRNKRVVVCALNGTSAPFPWAKEFRQQLQAALKSDGDYQLVDISEIRAHRIYDLLGLFEIAHCLVTIDTSIKHLAAACNVPVISLCARWPSPWHGSPWRPQNMQSYWYDELKPPNVKAYFDIIAVGTSGPKIVHTWADFRPENSAFDSELDRRLSVARRSWKQEYDFGKCWKSAEFTKDVSSRDSRAIGDPMGVPFLRDIIEHAERIAVNDNDVIVYSNADVCFAPGLTGHILDHCRRNGCAYTHRWDFFRRITEPFVSDGQVRTGKWYPGSDVFCFTVGWWQQHRDLLPDVIIGREKTDEVMRQLIKLSGGDEIEVCNYHEKHPSFWEQPEPFEKNPGNIHNRRLARKWFADMNLAENDYLWWGAATDRRTR